MGNILVKYWKYLLLFAVGIFLGLMINIPSCKNDNTIIYTPVHDTIVVDSIRIQEKTNIVYKDKIDTFYVVKADTVYLKDLPIEYKIYKDTIKTDSTSTEIEIDYHGFSSGIDKVYLSHQYYFKHEIIPEQKKRISPFVFVEIGPMFYPSFKDVNGIALGAGAGIYVKDKWGIGASYNFNTNLDHVVKLQLYRKW